MAIIEYNLIDVLATAIAVDEFQGFIKSKERVWIQSESRYLISNNELIVNILTNNETESQGIVVTDDHRQQAVELKEFFESLNVAKKLSDDVRGFDSVIINILSSDKVPPFGISVCASLPNSRRMQDFRDEMDNFKQKGQNNSTYIGTVKRRERMEVEIVDVKLVAKLSQYITTGLVGGKDIVKFAWHANSSSKLSYPDVSNLLISKKWLVDATIDSHLISDFTECHETILSNVKIIKEL